MLAGLDWMGRYHRIIILFLTFALRVTYGLMCRDLCEI
jgi:hypothetical protein